MALSISRKLWRRGRPSFCGVGKSPSMHSHSASERSVGYGLLMHARVAASTPDYPFSDSFSRKPGEQARLHTPRYRIGMRAYEYELPRMSLLGNSVNNPQICDCTNELCCGGSSTPRYPIITSTNLADSYRSVFFVYIAERLVVAGPSLLRLLVACLACLQLHLNAVPILLPLRRTSTAGQFCLDEVLYPL